MLHPRQGRRADGGGRVAMAGPAAPAPAPAEPPGELSPLPDPSPGRSARGLALTLGLVVAIALTLWMLVGLWGPAPPSGDDTMAHLVRAEFTIRELLPSLDGWQPRFGLGYQQFLFYGPGFTWLVALVHWLGLGLLSVAGALMVASVLPVVGRRPPL